MGIDEKITLRKLEIFLSFMRHGSMSKVADTMSLSTVSVHRALHSLQEGFRCQLFKKEGRSLIPLATAYTFTEFAEKSVSACEEGIRRTRLTAGFESTRIIIGSAYSLTVKTIPQLVFGLKSRLPQLDVDLKLGSTSELLNKLNDGELDAALVVTADQEPSDDYVSVVLFKDPIYFAAQLNSKYSGKKSIDLRELRDEPFVSLKRDFLTAKALQPMFEAAGFIPRITMTGGNLFSLANLVAEGIGFGLLPGRVALFTSQVELIPLATPFFSTQTIRLLIPRVREREPNLLAVTAECRKIARMLMEQSVLRRKSSHKELSLPSSINE